MSLPTSLHAQPAGSASIYGGDANTAAQTGPAVSQFSGFPVTPGASAGTETPGSVRNKWDLWVNGPHLRGANVYQRRIYPDLDGPEFMGVGPMGPPFTQEDFDRLAAFGANYVNISHSGLYTEKPPYSVDQVIQDNLDRLLEMIAKADMFAVIGFRSGPGRSEFALFYWDDLEEKFYDDSMWQDQAAQDAWVEMWRYTAERYRDNAIVVGYDLMVEPNSNDNGSDARRGPLEIWEPDEFYSRFAGSLYDWNQLYPRITAGIREVDTETPILIGGNGYSGVLWLPHVQPTQDTRTVYTVHQYEPQEQYTHKQWSDPDFSKATYPGVLDIDGDGIIDDQFDRAWLDNFLTIIDAFKAQHDVPVAVNEFGIVRWANNAADFMRDEMDLFEQRELNYALWEWQPDWQPLAEVDEFNFTRGPDPNNHENVATSDLIEVIKGFWGRNTIRPSTFPLDETAVHDFSIHTRRE